MNPQDSSFDQDPSMRDETGATATEYVMLVAFIAFALVATVTLFGTALNNYYVSLANAITSTLA